MNKKVYVTLQQADNDDSLFIVDQVTDSTHPLVGSVLTEPEVEKFCRLNQYKVTIKRAKG